MTSVACGPAPGGEYSSPLMSNPWLGTCSTSMAAGCAGSAGGSVNIAGGTDCASTAPAQPKNNTMKDNTERMVKLSTKIVLCVACFTHLAPRLGDPRFHVLEFSREGRGQQTITCRRDNYLILDTHAETALRQIHAGLDSEDRTDRQGLLVQACIVYIQPDKMAEAMNEIFQIPSA